MAPNQCRRSIAMQKCRAQSVRLPVHSGALTIRTLYDECNLCFNPKCDPFLNSIQHVAASRTARRAKQNPCPCRSTRTLSSQDSLPARVHPDARGPVGASAKRGSTGLMRTTGPPGAPGDSATHSSPTKPYSDSGSQIPQSARNHDKALIWEEPPAMPLDFGADHLSQPKLPQEPFPADSPRAPRRLQWFDSQLSGAGVPAVGFADAPPLAVAHDSRTRLQDASSSASPVALDIRRGMSRVACDHLRRIISQLLFVEEIASADEWLPVVHRLAVECAMMLSPTALEKHGTLDPRAYVKVKKVADASAPSASRVVQGVVFTKNLTHRAMRSEIRNPRVLLLQGALEYHRQNRLLTLDTLIPQEDDFVQASVQKARRFEPNLILVEKSVARRAQVCSFQHAVGYRGSTLRVRAWLCSARVCLTVQPARHLAPELSIEYW